MTTLTFDSIPHAPRHVARPSRRAPRPIAPVPLAVTAQAAPARTPRGRSGTLALVGAIAALHAAAIVSLSGGTQARPAHPQPAPITITLAAPRVEPPPPPPPPPKPQVQPPRVKAAAPPRQQAPQPAPSTPVVASDTPLAAPSADTVHVATAAPTAAPAPPAAAAPVEKLTEPRGYAGYLHNPAPAYPSAAQKRGLEGQVVLKVHVLATGQPDSVTVARSSGHAILDEAALKAVALWAFEPARRGQAPIDGWVQVPLNFKI
jgi:protein TonB